MSKELIINSTKKGIEMALLEDKALVELHQENGKQKYTVGDVFLAKVRKVVPSLNASFVDVGYEKDAFLHYLDLGAQFSTLDRYTNGVLSKKQKISDISKFKILPDIDKGGKVKDVISANKLVMVQIAKEPISSKGPRLTSEITLAGRFLVLVPFSDKISLSQKIEDEEERKRLRRLLRSILPKNFGVIVRTVAQNQKVAELDSDLRNLLERWNLLFLNLQNSKPPKKILGELSKTYSVLRDILSDDFSNIHVNDESLANDLRDYLITIAPEKAKIIKLHKAHDLFDAFSIHRMIKASFGKQVNLKSGAYLIIEHTEAMHVIDVNSGNRKGGVKNQEENAVQTNLECAKEIARVLRLRDMGGIICIDFIDMQKSENRKALHKTLTDAMSSDKAKHNILQPSRFGVVEITRQRVRQVTNIKTVEKCHACNGTGKIEASILITDDIENKISELKEKSIDSVLLVAHPMVEAFITKGFFWQKLIYHWKKKYGVKIKTEASSEFHLGDFKLYDNFGAEID